MDKEKKEKGGQPPSINKYMHPRNLYKMPPSFKKLATIYPEFRKHCTYDFCGKIHLDFKNPQALSALTTCLLEQDFGLKVMIPSDRLVPTLPLRLNYLLWIEDLLTLIYKKSEESNCTVTGLDIGTGAACIYPLLGAKKFDWHFVSTESDQSSSKCAQQNVSKNDLEKKILIKNADNMYDILQDNQIKEFINQVKVSTSYESKDNYMIDFTMCNPPFFSSEEELDYKFQSRKDTRTQPKNAPTGSIHEKVIEGGEVAFISKMIKMSFQYKNHIRIFTSLIGNKKNVKTIKEQIKEVNPAHFTVTEFCQGRTMRWGIAWTYDSRVNVGKILSKKQMCDAKPIVLAIPRTSFRLYTVVAVWKKVTEWLKILKIKPRIVKKNNYFVNATFKAYKETWLHQRKRKREKLHEHLDKTVPSTSHNGKRKLDSELVEDSFKKIKVDEFNSSNSTEENDSMEESSIRDLNDSGILCIDKTNEILPNKKMSSISDSSSEVSSRNSSINAFKMDSDKIFKMDCSDKTSKMDSDQISKMDNSDKISKMDSDQISKMDNSDKTSKMDSDNISKMDSDKPKMDSDNTTKNEGDDGKQMECLLRCSICVKQTNALINVELMYYGGTQGKEAMNRVMQFMKNQLKDGQ